MTQANITEATIVNGAAGMLYTGRDVPFSRQNKIGFSTRKNLLNNSAFNHTGGISPTGWQNTGATGISYATISTLFPSEIAWYSQAANERPFFSQNVQLNENTTYLFSVIIENVTTGAVPALNALAVVGTTTGATLTYLSCEANPSGGPVGIVTTGLLTVQIQTTVSVSPTFRCGLGGNSSTTGTMRFSRPQLEVGTTRSDYQRIGANPGTNVRFPALLSDPTKSAATDPLTFSGEAPFNGQLQESNCFTFDGSDDRVAMDLADIAGPELVTNSSTSLSGAATLVVGPNLVTGKMYLVSFTVSNYTGTGDLGFVGVNVFTGLSGITRLSGNGSAFGTVSALGSSPITIFTRDTNSATFSNISVRELPSTIRPNVVEDGTFDSSAIWTLGTGWTIGSGVATKTAGTASVLSQTEPFVIGRRYLLTYTLTRSAGTITPRFTGGTTVNGTARSAGGTFSEFLTTLVGNTTLEFSADSAFAGTVDNVVIREMGSITHDGTSYLTYRSQGDGFTGTAGTAFNIRFGDVEHIPCSEGHGSVLHGTRLNQAYTVVNGQFSNWTANKQNTYHYNTAEGYGLEEGDFPEIDPLTLPGLRVYLDPEDTTRMWRDAAGTNPVTAYGQEILRIRDKSDQVTFVQNTPGQGPVWGRHPVSGIRNLISFSEDVSNAAWSFFNVSGTATRVGNDITFGASAIDRILSSTLTIAANTQMTASFTLSGSGQVRLFLIDGTGLTQSPGNITLTSTPTRYTATFNLVNAGSQARCAIYNDSTGAPVSFTIHNCQFEFGPTATTYQRVTNRFDITEVGQPDLHYLSGNGTNQRMASLNPVDFSNTDKVTVWTSVRKLSDAADGSVVGLSTISSDGAWELKVPHSAGANASMLSKRTTTQQAVVSGIASPITLALIGEANIAGPLVRLTANGTTVSTTDSQGTGNYSNATLHLFSRGGSSLFFNGFCYGIAIGGDNYSASVVTEVDKLMRSKAGLVWYKDTFIPASQTNPGFDVLGNPLTNPRVVGLNGAESKLNFSPVANSWPTGVSIPGADIPAYAFNGDPGDIEVRIDQAKREAKFILEKE